MNHGTWDLELGLWTLHYKASPLYDDFLLHFYNPRKVGLDLQSGVWGIGTQTSSKTLANWNLEHGIMCCLECFSIL